MSALLMATPLTVPDDSKGNIEQRVFACFPTYPAAVTIFALYAALPLLDRVSIQTAVWRMKRDGLVENAPERFSYRLVAADVKRPRDDRGRKV